MSKEQNELTVTVGEFLFEFHSFAHWVNKAKSWFQNSGYRGDDCICIDAAGRICLCGAQFGRARDEETFPVKVYVATTSQG